jgi:hypothetical protein
MGQAKQYCNICSSSTHFACTAALKCSLLWTISENVQFWML